jgi:ABC-type glycerol-3-phosphate transport system permease component
VLRLGNLLNRIKKQIGQVGIFRGIFFILLLLYTISILILIMWAIFASLKTINEFRSNAMLPPISAPWSWAWDNYSTVINTFYVDANTYDGFPVKVYLGKQILNTILFAGVGSFVSTFVPCITAYATSKFNYKFSKVIYSTVIITMILPIVGAYPSELVILNKLGIYNRIWGNWIQRANFLGLYYLVFHATFRGISKEYSESAYVDGASEFRVMLSVILPLIKIVFFTIMLIKFIEAWNDYQTPLLYLPSYPTLAYGMYDLGKSNRNELSFVPMRMAACIMMITPIIILFVIFRDKMIGNLSMGGIKE